MHTHNRHNQLRPGILAASLQFGSLAILQGNLWQRLWDATAAQPTSQQQPLLRAEMEAERVFHDLENVPPRALWDQLLSLAAVAAASMLAACPAAHLAPAQHCLA